MTNEAIKLAVENGWKPNWVESRYAFLEPQFRRDVPLSSVYLDSLFWQALGKALGWGGRNNEEYMNNIWPQEEWLYHWHDFICWIAEGKPADSFFTKLIKNHDTTKTNA